MTLKTPFRITILVLGLLGLLLPPFAAGLLGFTSATHGLTIKPLIDALRDSSVVAPILNTLMLTAATIIGGFALVIPTLVWMHLRAPHLLAFTESVSMLPYLVPSIALVSGVSIVLRPLAPGFFAHTASLIPFYILITLPFLYRAVDSGLRTLDLRTLVTASESLGAGRIRTGLGIILPNLRGSLLTGTILAATMVTGELVMASLLLHQTFPTMLLEIGESKIRVAAAMSFVVTIGTWLLMAALVGLSGRRNPASVAKTLGL